MGTSDGCRLSIRIQHAMGFALTLSYLVLTFLSPDQLFPTLADYRPMLWLGLIAALGSVPVMLSNHVALRSLQIRLLLGLLGAMMLSEIAGRWFGGVLVAVQQFGPSILAFVLVAVNVTTMKRLRLLAIVLVAIGVVLSVQALLAYHWGINAYRFTVSEKYLSNDDEIAGIATRVRAVGFLQDPNDFAQFLLMVLPFVWVAWKRGLVRKILVILPTLLLVYTVYLTRSRGALLGGSVLVLVALLPRLGKIASITATLVLAFALLGSGFLAGRNVAFDMAASDESAHNRLEAWSEGLGLFKQSPLFGVGYTRFTEHVTDRTAHNSFVLCLAELGLVGATIWVALLVTTMMSLNRLAQGTGTTPPGSVHLHQRGRPNRRVSRQADGEDGSGVTADGQQGGVGEATYTLMPWAHAMRVGLSAFLATAWFLSRTYVTTLYVALGMAVALIGIASPSQQEQRAQRRNWLPVSCGVEFAALALVYVMARMRH